MTIIFERRDRIAFLSLNRPDVLNSLNPDVVREMAAALDEVGVDEDIKALVVSGEGGSFSVGGDLKFTERAFADLSVMRAFNHDLNRVLCDLERLPVPVIAVIKGFALAGGLELALACDLVLAADDATIGDQHINFALVPGGGSSQRLPRKIGLQRAMYLLFSGSRLSGSEAQSWGLVHKAVPADQLDVELEGLLSLLRDKSREALATIKRAVYGGLGYPAIPEAIEWETRCLFEYLSTSDHPAQGLKAFLEKRTPEF